MPVLFRLHCISQFVKLPAPASDHCYDYRIFYAGGFCILYLTKISTALDMDYSLYKYWVVGLSHSLQINTFGEDLIPICLTLVVYLFLPTAISLSLFLRLDLRDLERR